MQTLAQVMKAAKSVEIVEEVEEEEFVETTVEEDLTEAKELLEATLAVLDSLIRSSSAGKRITIMQDKELEDIASEINTFLDELAGN